MSTFFGFLTSTPANPVVVNNPYSPGVPGCHVPPWDYEVLNPVSNFAGGAAIVAMVHGTGTPTDTPGNSWSEVASYGNLHCYVCQGPTDYGPGDKIMVYGVYNVTFRVFQYPSRTLDITPTDTAGGEISWTTTPLGGGGFLDVAVTDPVTTAWEEQGVLCGVAWKNPRHPEYPISGSHPRGIYSTPTAAQYQGVGTTYVAESAYEQCYHLLDSFTDDKAPSYGIDLYDGDEGCPAADQTYGPAREWLQYFSGSGPIYVSPVNDYSQYLVVLFKTVESDACGGVSPPSEDPGDGTIRACRIGGSGQLFTSRVVTAQLIVDRRDDSLTEGVDDQDTLESDLVTSTAIAWTRFGTILVPHAINGVVKLYTSRNQGRTWTLATTIATGYQGVAAGLDEATGLYVAAVYNSTSSSWYLTVGTLDEDGVTWTFTSPVLLVAGARNGAHMQWRRDGTWEFIYVTTTDVVTIARCRDLKSDGTGTFS